MFEVIRQLVVLFSPREKKQALVLTLGMIVMAMLEVIGIGFVLPFMAILVSPNVIYQHKKLTWVYNSLHFTSEHHFLFFVGVLVFIVLILTNAYSALLSWLSLKFGYARAYTLSRRLLKKYLDKPYMFFLNNNTSELSKNVLAEVDVVISAVLIPCMLLLSKAFAIVFIVGLLIFINPMLALVMMVVLGSAYVILFSIVKKKLMVISGERVNEQRDRFKSVSEAFGGIKDVKFLGVENIFLERYSASAKQLIDYNASGNVIAQIPRYALESIAFGGFLLIVLYFLATKSNFSQVMPLMALYAFAGYRLMPALQALFTNWAQVRSCTGVLDLLYRELLTEEASYNNDIKIEGIDTDTNFSFHRGFSLRDISFTYPRVTDEVIHNLNLLIEQNTTIGLVGSTGAGKTTLVDIILGLLWPQKGAIFVEDLKVTQNNLAAWQKNLGYVPQHIFLCDDTIESNIAFGVPIEEIDHDAVENAAKIANLHNFIVTETPKGYQTVVGERGIRLSGGQRQRIGIARALYRDPEILILDEATSALDGITEDAVLDAIHCLSHKKTIIIIAHRLSTVQTCDVIYMLEKGNVVAQGTYQHLLETNKLFQAMAKVKKFD